jgi:hypothetical protein
VLSIFRRELLWRRPGLQLSVGVDVIGACAGK